MTEKTLIEKLGKSDKSNEEQRFLIEIVKTLPWHPHNFEITFNSEGILLPSRSGGESAEKRYVYSCFRRGIFPHSQMKWQGGVPFETSFNLSERSERSGPSFSEEKIRQILKGGKIYSHTIYSNRYRASYQDLNGFREYLLDNLIESDYHIYSFSFVFEYRPPHGYHVSGVNESGLSFNSSPRNKVVSLWLRSDEEYSEWGCEILPEREQTLNWFNQLIERYGWNPFVLRENYVLTLDIEEAQRRKRILDKQSNLALA